MLQLRALQDIASSDNAKVVVPYEATSLMGAAEVLLSTLRNEDLGGGTNGVRPPQAGRDAGTGRPRTAATSELSLRPALPEWLGCEISVAEPSIDVVASTKIDFWSRDSCRSRPSSGFGLTLQSIWALVDLRSHGSSVWANLTTGLRPQMYCGLS